MQGIAQRFGCAVRSRVRLAAAVRSVSGGAPTAPAGMQWTIVHSTAASLSANGRWIGVQTNASDVVPDDDNGADDGFVVHLPRRR
ncbi:MAG: hypothetical protein HMLKMBBP_03223 [Planctomycetes bacterium]|nr:hypothetical protein [Planctomycetota bacterium]